MASPPMVMVLPSPTRYVRSFKRLLQAAAMHGDILSRPTLLWPRKSCKAALLTRWRQGTLHTGNLLGN